MTQFTDANEAMSHLRRAIDEILTDGWSIKGIDPSQVVIFRKAPEIKPPRSPVYDGDLSTCCGAPMLRTGTCQTCTSCGTTSGCS